MLNGTEALEVFNRPFTFPYQMLLQVAHFLRSQVKQHMWPTKRYIELLASTLMCLDISWGISLCCKLLSKLCWSPAQIMFPEKNFLYSEIFMEAFIHFKESVWIYKFPMIQQHINIPSKTFLLTWGKFFSNNLIMIALQEP